jgi:hypothetical protein
VERKMSIKKYTHYFYPILGGLICLVFTILYQNNILTIIEKINKQDIFFIYATTIFGFGLATYGIFLSFIPNLKKSIQQSDTLESINRYYFIFLFLMLIQLITSLIFVFYTHSRILFLNVFIFGSSIVMLYYLIRGIKAMYFLVLKD